jgi:hypothetical protein
MLRLSCPLIVAMALCFLTLAGGRSAVAQGELSVDQQIEVVRSMNEARRQATVAANVQIPAEAADTFWPLYREYRGEVASINDSLKRVVLRYAEQYESLTGEEAYELAEEALDLQVQRDRLKQKYLKRFTSALPDLDAARVMQIENKIDALAQFALAANIPLAAAR